MRLVALAGLLVALLFIEYGVWLVVTPDYAAGVVPSVRSSSRWRYPCLLVTIAALRRRRKRRPQ